MKKGRPRKTRGPLCFCGGRFQFALDRRLLARLLQQLAKFRQHAQALLRIRGIDGSLELSHHAALEDEPSILEIELTIFHRRWAEARLDRHHHTDRGVLDVQRCSRQARRPNALTLPPKTVRRR